MTPDERLAARLDRWRNPGVEFVSDDARAQFKARVDRVIAALMMEQPDRVPVTLSVGFWSAGRKGMTPYDAMRQTARAAAAATEHTLELQPDIMIDPAMGTMPASVFESIDYKLYRWPGHGVPADAGYQYVEDEWMLADEYDQLISDPSSFMLRTYLPRAVGAFSGFTDIASLFKFIEMPFTMGGVGVWGQPAVVQGLQQLAAASRDLAEWGAIVGPEKNRLMSLGYPGFAGGGTKAPFDILGDTLRGTKGILLDMYRQPDKVLAACERLVPVAIDLALRHADRMDTPIVGMPLHKGAEGFMSQEQFDRFYWPTLRAVILGLVEQGCIPWLFAEGRFASRLEHVLDIPKARTTWMFDQTDMGLAKKTVGQVACIQGNVPLSLVHAGTKDEMVAFVRTLIEKAAPGGGYILAMGAGADSGREENLRAMVETAREYGVYPLK